MPTEYEIALDKAEVPFQYPEEQLPEDLQAEVNTRAEKRVREVIGPIISKLVKALYRRRNPRLYVLCLAYLLGIDVTQFGPKDDSGLGIARYLGVTNPTVSRVLRNIRAGWDLPYRKQSNKDKDATHTH